VGGASNTGAPRPGHTLRLISTCTSSPLVSLPSRVGGTDSASITSPSAAQGAPPGSPPWRTLACTMWNADGSLGPTGLPAAEATTRSQALPWGLISEGLARGGWGPRGHRGPLPGPLPGAPHRGALQGGARGSTPKPSRGLHLSAPNWVHGGTASRRGGGRGGSRSRTPVTHQGCRCRPAGGHGMPPGARPWPKTGAWGTPGLRLGSCRKKGRCWAGGVRAPAGGCAPQEEGTPRAYCC